MLVLLSPFLAALGTAFGIITDKINLSKYRVSLEIFIPVLFVFLCFITGLFMPFLGWVDVNLAYSGPYLLVFGLMIATAVVWNFFYYSGMQKEKLYEFELIITLTPLITILFAGVLFPSERHWGVLIAGLVASLALILAHLHRNHLEFDQYSLGLVICVFLMALEIILQKILLAAWSPVSLYFFRTAIILAIFWLFYRPNLKNLSGKSFWLIVLTAGFGVVQMVLKFYGFRDLGVVYTTLIMLIAPIIVYFASFLIFKEQLKKRTIFAALIILVCIVYATLA